ncbi:hypothetical protein B0H34DRAFT_490606 [Crassisporium funariophilum]|nr:hypothetical protein B0H34DRAFT_490606 [Crassisporium funariophilum]
MPTTISDLPYDIWLHIVSYIPKSHLQTLYSVNHVLFESSMDARYASVSIFEWRTDKKFKSLFEVKAPLRACRVRDLHLRPGPIGSHFQRNFCDSAGSSSAKPTAPQRWRRLGEKLGLRRSRKDLENHPTQAWARDLFEIVEGLTNVEMLHLECAVRTDSFNFDSFAGFRCGKPLIFAGWKAYSSNLRSLKLNFPLEALVDVLPIGTPSLPCLEDLEVVLSIAYRTTDPSKILCSLLLPFIVNHGSTLRSLNIHAQENLPLSLFFSRISLPLLTSLSLGMPCIGSLEQADTSGLHVLLQTHAPYLKNLRFVFFAQHCVDNRSWLFSRCLYVPMPDLETLECTLYGFPSETNRGIPSFVEQYHKTLVSLSIRTNQLSEEDFHGLLSTFPTPCTALKRLEFETRYLDPSIFENSERLRLHAKVAPLRRSRSQYLQRGNCGTFTSILPWSL